MKYEAMLCWRIVASNEGGTGSSSEGGKLGEDGSLTMDVVHAPQQLPRFHSAIVLVALVTNGQPSISSRPMSRD